MTGMQKEKKTRSHFHPYKTQLTNTSWAPKDVPLCALHQSGKYPSVMLRNDHLWLAHKQTNLTDFPVAFVPALQKISHIKADTLHTQKEQIQNQER